VQLEVRVGSVPIQPGVHESYGRPCFS
jgi:hypothetical protein